MTRTMKWAITLLLIPAAVAAQGPQRGRAPGPRPGGRDVAKALLERGTELDLTTDQQARLEALSKEWQDNAAALRASMEKMRGNGDPESLTEGQRAELRALREQTMETNRKLSEQIRSTLTLDQLKKAEPILGGGRGARVGRGGRGRSVAMVARVRSARRGPGMVSGFRYRGPVRAGVMAPIAPRVRVVPDGGMRARARVAPRAYRMFGRI